MVQPFVVGIAGGSGSGKTTLVRTLLNAVDSEYILFLQHDSYYRDLGHLPEDERENRNFDHPSALETGLLVRHLEQLRGGEAVDIPVYDFSRHVRKEKTRTVQPKPVILLEGILILADKDLRDLMDFKLYVEADNDLRLKRRIRRDLEQRGRSLESVLRRYKQTVRPMHRKFVEPSKRHADRVVPGDKDPDSVVEDILPVLEELAGL